MAKTKKQSPLLTPEERILELEHRKEALEAKNERLNANLDYVAMMTDVDIPTEEGGK